MEIKEPNLLYKGASCVVEMGYRAIFIGGGASTIVSPLAIEFLRRISVLDPNRDVFSILGIEAVILGTAFASKKAADVLKDSRRPSFLPRQYARIT